MIYYLGIAEFVQVIPQKFFTPLSTAVARGVKFQAVIVENSDRCKRGKKDIA